MNNENKKLSHNRKNKTEKKKIMREDEVDLSRFFELATSDKIYIDNLNLHEIKKDIMRDYDGVFEMNGTLKVGEQNRQTLIRFRNMDDYEVYINSIDQDYDSDDTIFNGYINKINTPQFNKVNRSQYGNGCSFDKIIIEYRGNNCFIPTKGYCFVKCINFITGKDYKQKYLDFIRNETRRSNIMTKARIQPFCKANNIDIGYYNDERVFPRSVTNRDNALYLYNNHFCVIWKNENISFKDAVKELKDNFKIVDNYITEENVNSHFKYEYIPKKINSHLTNFIVYDIETFGSDRARPYCISFYRLSKIAGRYDRDQTQEELEKCKQDTIVFDGEDCIDKALDYCLKLKGEERKTANNKVVEYNLQLHAHNGSGFDNWIILNNLPCNKHIVGDIIKNGKGIISLKVFNGYIEKDKKQIPQYLHFRCGMTHLNYSLKKLGKTFELQKELLKTEMKHDDVYEDTWRNKKSERLDYVKNDVLCTAFSYARYCKNMEDITKFSMKDCLSLPGLGWKYFNSLRTSEDEAIYTYNDKYMRRFVRQSIKGGRVCAFNQYYKSIHFEDIKNIISKFLDVKENIYEIFEEYLKYKKKHYEIFKKEYES